MAGEVKYGNTLISSRKDSILSYAKYIYDIKSGKNVEEVLEELKQSVKSVDITTLDSLNDTSLIKSGQPVVYAVTDLKRNAGVLFLFSDNSSHVITQILTTHNYWTGKDFSVHHDHLIHCYCRSYNRNSPYAPWDKGTWSEWNPFIDADLQEKINQIDKIKALEDTDIDDVWNTIFNIK